MSLLFSKLNLKDEKIIYIMNAQKYFSAEVEAPQGVEIKSVVDESNLIHFPIPLQKRRRPVCHK